ncbi:hypothetical protein [Apibacter adventoris]|uniref:hypothetical protein n=1 Tax=Apibacter adventoris TaxID=1679466 RepID=UPI000CF5E46B|nr:hypothetical protein [Apibacter adventoris]PQL95200.1 hypothetical protein C4S76_03165 [Apibacter adventoris]
MKKTRNNSEESQTETVEIDNKQRIESRFGIEQIKKWKLAFKNKPLNYILVEDKMAALRPITSEDVASYTAALTDQSEGLDKAFVNSARILLNELWLDGDNELKDEDDYFSSVMLQIQGIIEVKKTIVLKF